MKDIRGSSIAGVSSCGAWGNRCSKRIFPALGLICSCSFSAMVWMVSWPSRARRTSPASTVGRRDVARPAEAHRAVPGRRGRPGPAAGGRLPREAGSSGLRPAGPSVRTCHAMTELLYLHDSYLREFDATVEAQSGQAVSLDRTSFYVGGGGQPADVGLLRWTRGECRLAEVRRTAHRARRA